MPSLVEDLWSKALKLMEPEVSELSFSTWLQPLVPISCDNDTFILQASNDFMRSQSLNFLALIENALLSLVPVRYQVKIILASEREALLPPQPKPAPASVLNAGRGGFKHEGNPLIEEYTFETFVVGESNSFAQAACVSVAQRQGKFNPLFLYGGSGLGKTHLLHAIGNYVKQNQPDRKTIYVPCEQFVNEFIFAIKENAYESFRAKYRRCDLLLIDDIQFIESKEQTQVEFFYTFNTLYEAGSQMVMTCDKPPTSLVSLEERLRTRFSSGLMIDIGIPDFETRMAILEKRAQQHHVQVSTDVLAFVAENIVSSIRELEGAWNTVVAYSYLAGRLDVDIAREALRNLIAPDTRKKLSPETMLQLIARYFNFTEDEIKSKNKNKDLANARQISMYLLSKHGNLTYEQIGRLLGGRHHSTVIHGYNKIQEELKNGNEEITEAIGELNRRILGT